jgi:protein-L-isoaspartate(D-aspartate) O-methyltransferase
MAVLFAAVDLPHVRKTTPVAASPAPPASVTPAEKAPVKAPPDQGAQPQPRYAKATVLAFSGGGVDIATRNLHPPLVDRAAYVGWMREHTSQADVFLSARWDCAQAILSLGQIQNTRVLEGFLLTPREEFCRSPQRAYENAAMPIGYGQTISGPYLVARMTDALNPQPDQRVLEVGTGSGYQSALLSELSSRVFSIEIVEDLARETDQIYRRLWDKFPEYHNVRRKIDDGYYGWPEYAPFDRIIVTCGIDHIPPELLRELAPEGIMVIPVGPPSGQTILRVVKHVAADGSVSLEREDIYHGQNTIIFVPFTSKSGLHREPPGDAGTGEQR